MNPIARILLGVGSVSAIGFDVWGIVFAFQHLVESTAIGAALGYLALLIILAIVGFYVGIFGVVGLILAAIADD